LFDFRHNSNAIQLLVLDRMDDPVTPLLSQWTYQAMLHELFGISGNRVRLNVSRYETQDVVISSTSDEFYAKNMYSNYGDLGLAMNKLVDDFQVRYTNFIELEFERYIYSTPSLDVRPSQNLTSS